MRSVSVAVVMCVYISDFWAPVSAQLSKCAYINTENKCIYYAISDAFQVGKESDVNKKLRKIRDELSRLRQCKNNAEIRMERIRTSIRHQILSNADIVASTLSSSGRQMFLEHILQYELQFDTCIIDEVTFLLMTIHTT